MSLDPDTITQQLTLLAAHRRTLAYLLEQAAVYGGVVLAPPQTANGIAEARAEIQRIKADLRASGVPVEDESNDEALPQADAPPGGGAGSRVQSTVTVQDNQGTIIGVQINQPQPSPALHQLRAPVGDFVGREREIDQLVQSLSKAASGGTAAAISAVRGLGGIGKTELAYVVANRIALEFPDAQFLIELRGASSNPLTPEQALQTVIRVFEPEARLPDDLGQLQALYRSLLTGRRALILADDARDAAQVRPLLSPLGCALLVTSRRRFTLPGMAALDLGTLPPQEAVELLLTICPRIGEHAPSLAKLCGYLPLALRVSAGMLETNDARNVPHYLKQLEAERLKHLSDPDDPQASVEASLQLSYDALEPGARTALCQLSVFPTSFDPTAAQAVVAVAGDIPEVLELLRRRSLLEWDTQTERFSLHDLARAFAAGRLEQADAVRLRHAKYYAEVAYHTQYALYLKGMAGAGLALFDRERTNIDAGWGWVQERAGNSDADTLLVEYATATSNIGNLRYDKRRERIPQLEALLAAAKRLGNRDVEGVALGNLGLAYAALGDARQSITFHEQALTIMRELGNRRNEGASLGNLGTAYKDLGEPRQAITFHEQALVIHREIGNRRSEGNDLGNLGIAYDYLGDAWQAITFNDQWLAIAREIGDRHGEGNALINLGIAYAHLGDARRAITFHEQALAIAREIGDRRGEGSALGNLGTAFKNLRNVWQAITFHEQHLAVAREIGDRHGEGNALGNLGLAYAALGDARQAITFHEQALAIAREIGDRRGESISSWNLGLALEKQGDLARAAELMQVSVEFEREIGHPDAEKDAAQLEHLRQRLAASQNPPPAEAPDNE